MMSVKFRALRALKVRPVRRDRGVSKAIPVRPGKAAPHSLLPSVLKASYLGRMTGVFITPRQSILKVLRASRVPRVPRARTVLTEDRARRVLRALKALRVPRARTVASENRVRRASRARRARRVRRVFLITSSCRVSLTELRPSKDK